MHAAVIATTVTTPATVPFRLFIAGEDVIKRADGSGVPLRSIEFESSGTNSPATLRADHDDPAGAVTILPAAPVRLWDQAQDRDVFGGYLIGRTSRPGFGQQGRVTELVATDWSLDLDRALLEPIRYPAGLSDQQLIMGVIGQAAHGPLGVSSTDILATNVAMPAMAFDLQTLRSALEAIATAAAGDGQGDRILWVDENRVVAYRLAYGLPAPYTIVENPVGGTQRAAENLELVDDDSGIVTAVYVRGANAAGSGWEVNGAGVALFGFRADPLDAPDSDSLAKRQAYGQGYLAARAAPIRRGTFQIKNTTGWEAGQNVTITNAELGLVAAVFGIVHVTATPIGGSPVWQHDIEFGARRPSVRRNLRIRR